MTVKDLEKKIKEAAEAYYNGEPFLSDYSYDKLIAELRERKPNSKVLKQVGAKPRGQVVKHKIPMGSLNKADDLDALTSWRGKHECVMMEKLDGCAIDLRYVKGKLVQALTRGDGKKGEDITENALLMKNVNKTIKGFTGHLRGEVVMSKLTFETKYADVYANPRNTTSGIMRRHDGRGCENLTVMYYRVITKNKFAYFSQMLRKLVRLVGTHQKVFHTHFFSISEFKRVFDEWEEEREDRPFDCDGVVIVFEDLSVREEGDPMLPKNMIAYKYAPEIAQTTVRRITWEAGRTGRVNPTVILKPVQLAGVEVRKATGNNYFWMKEMGLGVAAVVEVSRRGDVIPAVESVVKRGQKLLKPLSCPACGADLKMKDKYLMCRSKACPAKIGGAIQHWVRLIDVKGLGPANLRALMVECGVERPADLYTMKPGLTMKKALGVKTANKIWKELMDKLEVPLEVVFAAHIPNIGRRRFRKLMRAGYDTPKKLFKLTVAQIWEIDGFSGHLSELIVKRIKDKRHDIEELLKHIKLKKSTVLKKGATFAGFGFQFTGKMEMKRAEMEALAMANGAEIGWKKERTNILVIADASSNSGKAKKARAKDYAFWTPEEFLSKVD